MAQQKFLVTLTLDEGLTRDEAAEVAFTLHRALTHWKQENGITPEDSPATCGDIEVEVVED